MFEVKDHMTINLHNFLERSTENGPGVRAVIWVQGCALHCPGCFNPDTHDMHIRELVSVDELARKIFSISGIEGITISGGEPFLQAAPLAELAGILQKAQLSVVVFSGLTFEQLREKNDPHWNALLAKTDLLIAGPFIQELASDLPLRGSRNQTLHYLSERYKPLREHLENTTNSIEILINRSGQVTMTGFPGQNFLGNVDDDND